MLQAGTDYSDALRGGFVTWLKRSPAERTRYVDGHDMQRAALVETNHGLDGKRWHFSYRCFEAVKCPLFPPSVKVPLMVVPASSTVPVYVVVWGGLPT